MNLRDPKIILISYDETVGMTGDAYSTWSKTQKTKILYLMDLRQETKRAMTGFGKNMFQIGWSYKISVQYRVELFYWILVSQLVV